MQEMTTGLDKCFQYHSKPIHWVIHSQIAACMDCMDILLSADVDVNAKDYEDDTILHYAAQESDNKLIKFLLANTEIDILQTNNKLETAETICKKQANPTGAELLSRHSIKSGVFILLDNS